MSGQEQLNKRELRTILVQAVLNGHLEAVEMAGNALVEHFKRRRSVGPQALDFHGKNNIDSSQVPKKYHAYTPLMMALEEGKTDIAKKLMELGASVALRSKKNRLGPLHIASNKGQGDLMDMILAKAQKQKVLGTGDGDQHDLDYIINGRTSSEGWTPLMYAAKSGHLAAVKSLMKCDKLKCSVANKKGHTAVHIAGKEGQLDVLQELHRTSISDDEDKHDAETLFMARDDKGWNILHHVCARGHVGVLDWLLATIPELKTRECLNQKSKSGYTPLLVACEYDNEEIIKFLLELEDPEHEPLVEVDACTEVNDEGTGINTGLHLAAIHDTDAVAKVLIKKGCPIDAKDAKGNTALHIAVEKLSNSVASVIRSEGGTELDLIKNDAGEIPNDLAPKEVFIIPVEIEKRGSKAMTIYIETLQKGKRRIPYCNLLILGQERTGKTSLYHQLVGNPFQEDLDPTRGIDNKIVDTVVDTRQLSIEEWQEKDAPESGNRFSEELASLLEEVLPPNTKSKEEVQLKEVSCKLLKQRIQRIVSKIKELKLISESEQPDAARLPPSCNFRSIPLHPSESRAPTHGYFPQASPQTMTAPSPLPLIDSRFSARRHIRGEPLQRPEEPPPSSNKPATVKSEKREKPRKLPIASKPPSLPASRTPTSPLVTSPTTPTSPSQPRPTLGRKQSLKLNQLLKKRGDMKYKDPSLVLNTLDFAGQKEYRPMHHCFISRRGLYLVVFKIPDMIKYIRSKADSPALNPFEELRYWLHSIHAHIISPTEDSDEQNLERIFLVGTHKESCARADIDKIFAFFSEDNSSRYINHIHRSTKYFFAVENSIDKKSSGDEYLTKSGTKELQDDLKQTANDLPFLNEDHPVMYLYLEDCIENLRISSRPTPIVDLSKMREVAEQCGLGKEKEQNVAFQFFHDTGKILWLKNLPRLFLAEKDRKELENLVILHRPWIFDVMKVIMELSKSKSKSKKLANTQIDTLNTRGVADLNVLKECWEDFTNQSIEIHHMCLILQAYCLIYPIFLTEEYAMINSSTSASHSQENLDSSNCVEKYLIPCKLPELSEEVEQNLRPDLPWFSMYFDFSSFLPAEIYHRLVCLLLASETDSQGPRRPPLTNVFTSTMCVLYKVKDLHWKVEYKRNCHKLIISVVSTSEEKIEHIDDIHKNYLVKICDDSDLQGLSYYGGPLDVQCCTECSADLHYVSYHNGKTKIAERDGVICELCMRKTNIHEELKKKLMIAAGKVESASGPSINNIHLQLIRWIDRDGAHKSLRIYRELASCWKNVSNLIGLSDADKKSIQNPGAGKETTDCIPEVLGKWMENASGLPAKERYPLNWQGMCNLLEDCEKSSLCTQLKEALAAKVSTLKGNYQGGASEAATTSSTSSASPIIQGKCAPENESATPPRRATSLGPKKMNCEDLARWLEEEGIHKDDIALLKDAGINGRAFMKLTSGQSLFDKLKEGTRMLIDELQEDLPKTSPHGIIN